MVANETISHEESLKLLLKKAGNDWVQTEDRQGLPDEIANRIIEAYQHGKRDIISQMNRDFVNAFVERLMTAMKATIDFKTNLENDFGIKIKDLYLKVEGPADFSAVLIIPADLYNSEGMLQLMEMATEREGNLRESIEMYFKFLPDHKTLNIRKLTADGFNIKYDGQRKTQTQTRTA